MVRLVAWSILIGVMLAAAIALAVWFGSPITGPGGGVPTLRPPGANPNGVIDFEWLNGPANLRGPGLDLTRERTAVFGFDGISPPRHTAAGGWPFPAIHSGADPWPMEFDEREVFRPDRRWPRRVLWPGAIGNAAIFAAATAPLLWLAVRAWRRRRGRCVRCTYPRAGLADDSACPECGLGA